MVDAIERYVDYEEQVRSFAEEALAADADIEKGGEVYGADDVHAWMRRLAVGESAVRPKPWRSQLLRRGHMAHIELNPRREE
jgi:hypothetical protein